MNSVSGLSNWVMPFTARGSSGEKLVWGLITDAQCECRGGHQEDSEKLGPEGRKCGFFNHLGVCRGEGHGPTGACPTSGCGRRNIEAGL